MKDEKFAASNHESNADTHNSKSSPVNSTLPASRRGFLKTAGLGAAALTASVILPGGLVEKAEAIEVGPASSQPVQRGNEIISKTGKDNETSGVAFLRSESAEGCRDPVTECLS